MSFSLGTGELRCIIGPNGAGKSTLFQLLSGQIEADGGRIIFDGRDITNAHLFERARMGIAVKPQGLGVLPELTVGHNLRIALYRRMRNREISPAVNCLLRRIGLSGLENALVRTLSHGQRQWLALGMALALRPRLLLLDEPTAGMSAEETRMTTQIVRDANAEGTTIVVIEHDMAFVRQLKAPVTVLHLGRVFAQGEFSEIEANEEVRQLYLGKGRTKTTVAKPAGRSG